MNGTELCEDYDWNEAFSAAGVAPVDVEEVLWKVEGENDGNDWIALTRTTNGRFLFIYAGCDYTGWDCQNYGSYLECSTKEAAFSPLFVPVNERDRDPIGFANAAAANGVSV